MIKNKTTIRSESVSCQAFLKIKIIFFIPFFLISFFALSQNITPEEKKPNYITKENISYRTSEETTSDNYIAERCKLDIYYPSEEKGFATIIWFHGGGINSGNKYIPEQLKEKGNEAIVKKLHENLNAGLWNEKRVLFRKTLFSERYNR